MEGMPICLPPTRRPAHAEGRCISSHHEGSAEGEAELYRKPEPNTERAVIIPTDEFEKWATSWEQRTNLCRDCKGSGEELASISVYDGAKYRPCRQCKGTGKPIAAIVTI